MIFLYGAVFVAAVGFGLTLTDWILTWLDDRRG